YRPLWNTFRRIKERKMYVTYKKDGWIGKIYSWYHGYHKRENSCGVRRTLLLAPFKLVLYPRVQHREWPLWAVYLNLFCLWMVIPNFHWFWDSTNISTLQGVVLVFCALG